MDTSVLSIVVSPFAQCTVGYKIKFQIPFHRTAVARLRTGVGGGVNGTPLTTFPF